MGTIKMKLAIMQPYLFPYIGYWQLINAVNTFVIFDDVNFIKKGWINRNYILLEGKPHLFTLSLQKPSQNKLIKDTYLSEDDSSKQNFLKTIETAYIKAPCFNEVFPLISDIVLFKEKNLNLYLENSLKKVSEYLGLDTNFINSSNIEKNETLKGQDKILEICRKLDAKTYINLPGGVSLYDKNLFQKHDIELKFIKTGDIKYEQFNHDLVPNLSIIDLIMFNSKKDMIELLNKYKFFR